MKIPWADNWPRPVQGPREGVEIFEGLPIYHDFDWVSHFTVAPRRFKHQIKAAELCGAIRHQKGRCDFLLLTDDDAREPQAGVITIAGDRELIGAFATVAWLRRRTDRKTYIENHLVANDENVKALKRLPAELLKGAVITLLQELADQDDLNDDEFRYISDLYIKMAEGRLTPAMIDNIVNALDDDAEGALADRLIQEHPAKAIDLVENDQTERDVVALAYRREQVERFGKMLSDPTYFTELRSEWRLERDENVWQKFFQENQWILGYGLSYQFLVGVDDKLEQDTRGRTLESPGKRVDALMKTVGEVRALCLVELKTHKTALTVKTKPRSGIAQISSDLSAAIAQIQGTVATRERGMNDTFEPRDSDGRSLDQIYQYQPRSLLVVGSLREFIDGDRVLAFNYRTFEIFRKNILSPEIVTFDELYARARHIVKLDDDEDILTPLSSPTGPL